MFMHVRTYLSTEVLKGDAVVDTANVEEHLINAVLLHTWRQVLKTAHDAFRHGVVQRIVAGEHHDAVFFCHLPQLKPRLCHRNAQRFRFGAAGYDATVIVAQNNDRFIPQVRAEHFFTGSIETVDVRQSKHGTSGYSRVRVLCMKCMTTPNSVRVSG